MKSLLTLILSLVCSSSVLAQTWNVKTYTRKIDDRKFIVFSLPARHPVRVWLRTVTPVLNVRCEAGRESEVWIDNRSPATIESLEHDHTVRLRFDKEDHWSEKWHDSTDSEALFAPAPSALLSWVLDSRRLVYAFAPFNGPAEVETTFTLLGLRSLMKKHRDCDTALQHVHKAIEKAEAGEKDESDETEDNPSTQDYEQEKQCIATAASQMPDNSCAALLAKREQERQLCKDYVLSGYPRGTPLKCKRFGAGEYARAPKPY